MIVEQEGPVRIERLAHFYQTTCADCRWSGPLREHRVDAQDDFDRHEHREGESWTTQ